MDYMHELKEMLCDELEQIAHKGELSAGSLDTIDKLTHSIKSISTIMAMEDAGYSRDYVDKYRGASYAQKRDSMGRYSRRYMGRRGGYSRDEEMDRMVEKLEKMMEKTEDQNVKMAIRQAIETIEE